MERDIVSCVTCAREGGVDADAEAWADEPRVIEVAAKRFAFEPAEIQVTVGERLRLVLRSADGLQGIELEKFEIAKEINPPCVLIR